MVGSRVYSQPANPQPHLQRRFDTLPMTSVMENFYINGKIVLLKYIIGNFTIGELKYSHPNLTYIQKPTFL